MKFSIKDFFSKCDQIAFESQIWLSFVLDSLFVYFFVIYNTEQGIWLSDLVTIYMRSF